LRAPACPHVVGTRLQFLNRDATASHSAFIVSKINRIKNDMKNEARGGRVSHKS
jgi:hypothetical protein